MFMYLSVVAVCSTLAAAQTQLETSAFQVLKSWKSSSAEFDQFECQFTCWKFDPTAAPEPVHASWRQGEFRYTNSGQFIYRIDKQLFYAGIIDGKPKYTPQYGFSKDYWVGNGKQLLNIDTESQRCTTTEIPDVASAEKFGKESWLCPLLPVVSMSAEEMQQKYSLRLVETHRPDLVVIEARPKNQEASNWLKPSPGMLQIVLNRETLELSSIILHSFKSNPLAHPQREHYEFNNLKRLKHPDFDNVDFVEAVRAELPQAIQFVP